MSTANGEKKWKTLTTELQKNISPPHSILFHWEVTYISKHGRRVYKHCKQTTEAAV